MAEVFSGHPLFPGSSTLNQIERVLMWTGIPSLADLSALKTNFGKQLLDLVSTIKPVNKKELHAGMDPAAYDLLLRTLEFNCEKRVSIGEVLTHPYFAEFYRPSEIPSNVRKVQVAVNDNTKLTLK
jgi:mitogen-activated protein kinase 15